MFDYPLPKPSNTLYHKLGLSPEATAAEIRDAKIEIEKSLQTQKKSVDKELNRIFEKLPGLKEVQNKIAGLKAEQNRDNTQKILELIEKQSALEKEAEAINADFQKLKTESAELETRINELHTMQLERVEDRNRYDLKTPPCAILNLKFNKYPVFTDRKTTLFLLRSELSRYFEKKLNIHCYHPTDHTRNHFQRDFLYNKLLDGEKSGKKKK